VSEKDSIAEAPALPDYDLQPIAQARGIGNIARLHSPFQPAGL
jgi:hypothetical protein